MSGIGATAIAVATSAAAATAAASAASVASTTVEVGVNADAAQAEDGEVNAAQEQVQVQVQDTVDVPPATVVSLVELLQSAQLTASTSVSESPHSLHAALEATKQLSQANPALYPLVASAIIELLKAAVEEAKAVPADLEGLAVEWAGAPPSVAASVAAAVASENRRPGSSFLPSLASSCRALCTKRWGVWEGHLLDIGTEALQSRIEAIRGNINAIHAQRDRLLEQECEMNDASKIALRKAENDAMQARIRSSRAALEASKSQLAAVGEATSAIIESHRGHVVGLADEAAKHTAFKAEAAILARMQRHEDSLLEAHRGVDRVRTLVDVVNRLTFCRTRSYTTSGIEIEVSLSSLLRATIMFHVAAQDREAMAPELGLGGAGGVPSLVVSHTSVEIEKTERAGGSSSSASFNLEECERDLAEAFFVQVLCNDEIDGPLSMRSLERVMEPKDIPVAMRRVSDPISLCTVVVPMRSPTTQFRTQFFLFLSFPLSLRYPATFPFYAA